MNYKILIVEDSESLEATIEVKTEMDALELMELIEEGIETCMFQCCKCGVYVDNEDGTMHGVDLLCTPCYERQ